MEGLKAWFRNHLIIGNLFLMLVVIVSLIGLVYWSMDLGTKHNACRTVPNFVGYAMEDANVIADENDLDVVANDSLYVAGYPGGVVLEQHPIEGAVVKPGRKIYVTISAMNQRTVTVPYVAKRTLRQAVNLLETSGFTIEKLQYVRDIATNYVLAQFVNNQEIKNSSTIQAKVGSGVVLRVGVQAKAKPLVVPQLSGLTLTEAKHKLWETGLNVGEVSYDAGIPALERNNAKVYFQSVKANKSCWYGESVSIRLSVDKQMVETTKAEAEKEAEKELKAQEKAAAAEAKASEKRDDSAEMENLAPLQVEVDAGHAKAKPKRDSLMVDEDPDAMNATEFQEVAAPGAQ